MTTMNDLLYNYQDTNEFVCSDGRMSVNGICQVDQPADSVDTSNITNEIIETSGDGGSGEVKQKTDLEIALEKDATSEQTLKDIEKEKDIMSNYNTTPPDKFEWEFDKDKKIDNYKNTVNNNITEYNQWVNNNLINSFDSTKLASSAYTLGTGGSLTSSALSFGIPLLFAGGAISKAERERIQNKTDQDKQGDIHTIDMMTYDIPQPGDAGFNPHRDKGDQPHGTDTSGDFYSRPGSEDSPTGIHW